VVTPMLLRWAWLLLAGVAVPACFNVTTRAPGPLIVDDFEDVNKVARAPEFSEWSCEMVNPTDSMVPDHFVLCDAERDATGDGVLLAEFRITDPLAQPPDGLQQHGGVAVITHTLRNTVIDLRTFSQIAVDVRVGPELTNAEARVELGCTSAIVSDASPPLDPFLVSIPQPITDTWTPLRLDLTRAFGPGTQPTPPTIQDCMRLVDSVRIVLDAQLPDGQSTSGSLRIDDLKILADADL
jgi:hypothetical protein